MLPGPFSDAHPFGLKPSLHFATRAVHDATRVHIFSHKVTRVHKMSTPMSGDSKLEGVTVPERDAAQIIERLKRALEVSADADLAALLSVSRSTLSNWRARNSIPLAKLRPICRKYGIPLDVLLTGGYAIDRNSSAILDTDILAQIFRMLDRYGFIKLPEYPGEDYDPAVRAGAEFLQLQLEFRQMLEQFVSEGKGDAEGAKRALLSIKRGSSEGPQ